ncbi:uncharacterized protein LOC124179851 [Neodiprion fabricii]|uniref:uncharacterized protein LOC124179851 n=1 Tax=Neodiprion fabricii TaxID=2872261 RepID=UPI001ED8DAA8|nr:uncharacterized protein LOC124179851 [Neodiprion fabricii]
MMPRLAVKDEDKITILQYRQIVHLQKDAAKHLAENLIESLMHSRNFDKNALKRASELYNPQCKDNRALWFNKPRYDETFFGNESEQFTIDVLMTDEEIQLKIAENEEKSTTMMKDLAIDTTPQIHESRVVLEVLHDSVDIGAKEQYTRDDSNDDKQIKISNKYENKEESDYCGIKPARINSQIMNSTFFMGINHEEQWNIFRNSAVTIPPKFSKSESSDVNSSPEERLQGLSKKESSVVEFDDFGRIKVKGMQYTKKVLVTDLMAWNNSPISIELLKHVFKHHKFEKTLSFDVSKVLAGRRGSFRQEGAHENAAVELLKSCSDGLHKSIIMRLISSKNLCPDVADSRGNTGLLFAAARDRLEVIDVLLDLGANIDAINDECLTPLSLCILRLLELIHGVSNWSDAFLPKKRISEQTVDNDSTTFKNCEQWHGRISYESLVKRMPKQMDLTPAPTENLLSKFQPKYFSSNGESGSGTNAMNAMTDRAGPIKLLDPTNQHKSIGSQLNEKHPDVEDNHQISVAASQAQIQKYIFDMSPIMETFDSQRKSKISKPKRKNKIEIKTTDDRKPTDRKLFSKSNKPLIGLEKISNNNNREICAKIEKVHATISKLLQRGADPNFSQVPYPVTIMVIFTKTPSLLSELLEYGADPDTTLSKVDHYFTPLLILAILQPAYEHALMAKALLKAKANPSVRADSHYRSDVMERVRQNRCAEFLDSCQGMTALHLLAVRHDMDADTGEYLGTLIRAIYQYGRIKRSDLYQGHSPLSLAIFEGNFTATKALLRSTYVDVNEQLGIDLGNAMLMLESRVLQELLPPQLLQKFLELLLQYGGCPFESVNVLGEDYNQIEYGRKELMKLSNPVVSTTEIKEKGKKTNASKRSKSSKLSTATNFAKSMNFIETVAKEKLIRRIKANLVRGLMDLPVMLLPVENRLALLKEPLFKHAEAWMNAEDLAIIMETMNCSRSNVKGLVRLFVTACIPAYEKMVPEIDTLIQNETETIMNRVMPLVGLKKNVATAADYKVERASFDTETKNLNSIVVYPTETDPNRNKFKVCFECFGVHGKVLIVCPTCKQLYFCSQECNEKNVTLEKNPHQCPIFYQKERTRLERIAMILGIDPINCMREKFQNPELYTDLEKQIGLFIEQRENSIGERIENKADGDNVKSRKNPVPGLIFEKVNKEDDGGEINLQNIVKGGELIKNNSGAKNVGEAKIFSKEIDESYKDVKFKGKKIEDGNIKSKTEGEKTGYKTMNSKINSDEGYEMLSEKGREYPVNDNYKIENSGGYGRKYKETSKKGIKLHKNEIEDSSSTFKNKFGNLEGKKGDRKPNYVDTRDRVQKNREDKPNKENWIKHTDKKTNELPSHAIKSPKKKHRHIAENNIPKKYINWLLKVSKSAGKNLDIDMLLLPYVVFAQGDTYFRILPSEQYSKSAGNYSLI